MGYLKLNFVNASQRKMFKVVLLLARGRSRKCVTAENCSEFTFFALGWSLTNSPPWKFLARYNLETGVTSEHLVEQVGDAWLITFDLIIFSMVKFGKTQPL